MEGILTCALFSACAATDSFNVDQKQYERGTAVAAPIRSAAYCNYGSGTIDLIVAQARRSNLLLRMQRVVSHVRCCQSVMVGDEFDSPLLQHSPCPLELKKDAVITKRH
jgi:hypothetical protein